MQKITTFLWFDTQAEEAANFYISLFKNSRIISVDRKPDGTPFVIVFELDGQQYYALNGGPHFKFNEAMSLFVSCESQEEVDELWRKFTKDGEEQQCGWLKDKYGVSWQIIPTALSKMLSDPDPEKSGRVMEVMMQMTKIDLATLEKAYNK